MEDYSAGGIQGAMEEEGDRNSAEAPTEEYILLSERPFTDYMEIKGTAGLREWIYENYSSDGSTFNDDGIQQIWAGLRLLVDQGASARDVAAVIGGLGPAAQNFCGLALVDDRALLAEELISAEATQWYVLMLADSHSRQIALLLSEMEAESAGLALARMADITQIGTRQVLQQWAAGSRRQQALAVAIRANTGAVGEVVAAWLVGGADPFEVGKALAWTGPVEALWVVAAVAHTAGYRPAAVVLRGLWEVDPEAAWQVWSGLDGQLALGLGPDAISVGVPPRFVLADLQVGAALLAGFDTEQAYKQLLAVWDEDYAHTVELAVATATSFPVPMAGVVEKMLTSHDITPEDAAKLLAALPTSAATAVFTAIGGDRIPPLGLFKILTALHKTNKKQYHALANTLATGNPLLLNNLGKYLADNGKWVQLARVMGTLGNINAAAALLVALAQENAGAAVNVLWALDAVKGPLQSNTVLGVAFAHPQVMLPVAVLLAANPEKQRILSRSLRETTAETAAQVYGSIINANAEHPEATIEFLKIVQAESPEAAGAVMALLVNMNNYRPALVKLAARLILNGANDTAFLVRAVLAAPLDAAARLLAEAIKHAHGEAGDLHFLRLVYNALDGQPALRGQVLSLLLAAKPALVSQLLNTLVESGQTAQVAALLAGMAPATAITLLAAMNLVGREAVLPLLPDGFLTAIVGTAESQHAPSLLDALVAGGHPDRAAAILTAIALYQAAPIFILMNAESQAAVLPLLPDGFLTAAVGTEPPKSTAGLLQALVADGHPGRVVAILSATDPARAARVFSFMNAKSRAAVLSLMPDGFLTAAVNAADTSGNAAKLLQPLAASHPDRAAAILTALAPRYAAEIIIHSQMEESRDAVLPLLPDGFLTALTGTVPPGVAAEVLLLLAAGGHPGRVAAILTATDPVKAAEILPVMGAWSRAVLPLLPDLILTALTGTVPPRVAAEVLEFLAAGHPGRVAAILTATDPARAARILTAMKAKSRDAVRPLLPDNS